LIRDGVLPGVQATAATADRLRLRIATPIAPKPMSIIAQLAGSGTAATASAAGWATMIGDGASAAGSAIAFCGAVLLSIAPSISVLLATGDTAATTGEAGAAATTGSATTAVLVPVVSLAAGADDTTDPPVVASVLVEPVAVLPVEPVAGAVLVEPVAGVVLVEPPSDPSPIATLADVLPVTGVVTPS
jgi:hypothetical protein